MRRHLNLADAVEILRRLMPDRWLFALGRLIGAAMPRLRPATRAVVARNLEPFAADERELAELTSDFFERRQARLVMLLAFLEMKPAARERYLSFEGLEHLDEALADGRGVIFLGSHLNSVGVFMSVMVLRQRGYDVRLALPSDADLYGRTTLGRLLGRGRSGTLTEQIGGFFVQFNVRPIVKALKDNAVVVQTGDGSHSAAFATVALLGRQVPLPTGMVSIARSTGTPLVPFNVVGAAPNLTCKISPALAVDPDGDPAEAVARYAEVLDRDLRANLASWEHWLIPDAMDTMATWPEGSLEDRYAV